MLRLQRAAGNRVCAAWVQRLAGDKPTVRAGQHRARRSSELQQSLNRRWTPGSSPDGSTSGRSRTAPCARSRTTVGSPSTASSGRRRGTPSIPTAPTPSAPGKETDPANDFRIRGLPPDSRPATRPRVLRLRLVGRAGAGGAEDRRPRRDARTAGAARFVERGGRRQRHPHQPADRLGVRPPRRARPRGGPDRRELDRRRGRQDRLPPRPCRARRPGRRTGPQLVRGAQRRRDVPADDRSGVFGRVDTLLGAAIDKLASPGSLSPAERSLVKDLFSDDSDGAIAEVRSNLGDLRSHLTDTRPGATSRPTPQETDIAVPPLRQRVLLVLRLRRARVQPRERRRLVDHVLRRLHGDDRARTRHRRDRRREP